MKTNNKIKVKGVERPGNGSSSNVNKISNQVNQKSKESSALRPQVGSKMKTQKTMTVDPKVNPKVKPEGFIDDAFKVGKTALDVVTAGTKVLNEPLDLETYTKVIPDTIMKVVNTVNDIVDGQPKSKVILSGPVKGQQNVLLDKISKETPVFNTTSAPSGFGSDFSKPDTKITHSAYHVSGMPVSRITNTVSLASIYFNAQNNLGVAEMQYRTALFAYGSFGSRVDSFVQLFDRFKIVNLTYTYVPSTGTDTKGSVHMAFRRSPKAFVVSSTPIVLLSQLERYSENVPWKGTSMSIPVENEFLYTGDTNSTDVKWYANGYFAVLTSGNTNIIHPERLGNLYVSVTIDCYGAIPSGYFPSLLSGACLTRMLGMSIYQSPGNFTNNDLRNLFSWTKYCVGKGLERVKNDITCYKAYINGYSDLSVEVQQNSRRKLTSKGHKFRLNYEESFDLTEDQTQLAEGALGLVLEETFKIVDSIFGDKKRAANVVKSFCSELLNWHVLGSTYRPWMDVLLNFLPVELRKRGIINNDVCSIWNFIAVILYDLESLFSLDKDLVFDESLEFHGDVQYIEHEFEDDLIIE